MFETGDAVIPLATAVQWVVAMGAGCGAIIGYVWNWTLRRETRMQERLDAIREAARAREEVHTTELRNALERQLEDQERWRQSMSEFCVARSTS